MTNLLSPEQLSARGRLRRERLIELGDKATFSSPVVVEGWSGDRQVFGFGVPNSDHLRTDVVLMRSAFNADTVAVFADARMFSPDVNDPEDRLTFDRYRRGEVSLETLAQQGHPGIIDVQTILLFSTELGAFGIQTIPYLTQYANGRATGVIWDVEAPLQVAVSGAVTDDLTEAMQEWAISDDITPYKLADGGTMLWDGLDARRFKEVVRMINQGISEDFVILNADPKIAAAARVARGAAPGSVVAGNLRSEVQFQLVAQEVSI